MSDDKVTMTDVEARKLDWIKNHVQYYVKSGGTEGHILDLRDVGGFNFCPTFLLKTIGRKSGKPRIVPLMYGIIGGEVITAASKGGADVHPAWYYNVEGKDEVDFQIGTQAFRGDLRFPQGEELEELWQFLAKVFPPYGEYRKIAKREIPLLAIRARQDIPVFTEADLA